MIRGQRDTANTLADRIVVEMEDKIWRLEGAADVAPLTVLTMGNIGKKKQQVYDDEYHWLEQLPMPRTDAINNVAGYGAGAVNLVVDNSNIFNGSAVEGGQVIRFARTSEQALVTGTNDVTNTITVIRGYGQTAAAPLVDNDVIQVLGTAYKEGFNAPESVVMQPDKVSNFVQRFSETVTGTATADSLKAYGGKIRPEDRAEKGREYLKQMERNFLLAEPYQDNTNFNHPNNITGGLNYFVQTNRFNSAGALTADLWEQYLLMAFRYGAKRKLFVTSDLVGSQINKFGRQALQVVPKEKSFGVAINTYYMGPYIVDVVIDKILSDDAYLSGMGFMVQLDHLDMVYMKSDDGKAGDTRLRIGIEPEASHGYIDEWCGDLGFRIRLELLHSLIYNVTA